MDYYRSVSSIQSTKELQTCIDFVALLPLEVVEIILCYLSLEDKLRCSRVCRTWNNILSSLRLWKEHFYEVSICKSEPSSENVDWKLAYTKAKRLEAALLSPSCFQNVTYTLKKQGVYLGRLIEKFLVGPLRSVEYDDDHLLIVSALGYVWLWSDVQNMIPTSINVKAVWQLKKKALVLEARFSVSKSAVVFLLSNSHVVVANFQGVKKISWNCGNGSHGVKTICYSSGLDTIVTVEENEVRVWKILKDRLRLMLSFRYGFIIPSNQRCSIIAHWKEGRHLIILNPQFWIPELTDTEDGYVLSIVRNTNYHDNSYPSYISSYYLKGNFLYLHSLICHFIIIRNLDCDEAVNAREDNCRDILAVGEKMWISYGPGVTRGYKNSVSCYNGFNLSVVHSKQSSLKNRKKQTLCCLNLLNGFSCREVIGEWKQQLISANIKGQDVELIWFIPPKH